MNPQDKADLKKYKELKEQRNAASKKYNLAHADEIKQKYRLKTAKKQAKEINDLEPSTVKVKPDKPSKPNPIKHVKVISPEVIDYKAILFKKPKIKPVKMQKKTQKDDVIFI